jgi:hypothetical protein
MWINWDGQPFGYTENPDNWIFFFENRLNWQYEVEKKIPQTAILGLLTYSVQQSPS